MSGSIESIPNNCHLLLLLVVVAAAVITAVAEHPLVTFGQ